MKENIKTEYVIKEIFNKDGQDIREMLKKALNCVISSDVSCKPVSIASATATNRTLCSGKYSSV